MEMFSFDNRIAVCLHPINEFEDDELLDHASGLGFGFRAEHPIDSTPKLEPIRIDPNFCNSSLDIDETTFRTGDQRLTRCLNSAVTASDRAKYVWRTALGTRCMKSGVHKWEVVIDRTTRWDLFGINLILIVHAIL